MIAGTSIIIYPGIQLNKIETSEHDRRLTLEEMQLIVGGNIELVPSITDYMGTPCLAFINEDGKRLQLKPNVAACRLWYSSLGFADAMTASLDRLADIYDEYVHDGILGPMLILQGTRAFLGLSVKKVPNAR